MLAYEKLDQAAADNYRNSYGILIGQKPEVSYGYTQIAPEHLKGSADSEHPGEEASLAVDGKKDTIWHSNYGNGTKADIAGNKNNTYTILLDQKTDIGKLTYLPRQTGNNNGIILKYELSYSQTEDGDDFQIIPLADNTWANNRTEKKCFSGSCRCKKNPHPCTFHGRNPCRYLYFRRLSFLFMKNTVSTTNIRISVIFIRRLTKMETR